MSKIILLFQLGLGNDYFDFDWCDIFEDSEEDTTTFAPVPPPTTVVPTVPPSSTPVTTDAPVTDMA